jgi:predicted nucleotidyltransferase
LGDDFLPESDVDVLVVFQDDAKWNLFDHMKAEEELKQIFGREVDLVEKKAIRNPFRRHHILNNHEVIYAI